VNLENREFVVSVVIPTRNRPELVSRAVRSALNQTYKSLEVIVVIDGPDPATEKALDALQEPRLRVVSLRANLGGSETRNIGAKEAKGQWVALLDDDDEWLTTKIEAQIALCRRSTYKFPVVSSRLIARSPTADYVWPERAPLIPIADYLMKRPGLFQGNGLLQTSTLLVPTQLLKECPFTTGLRKHQDWDWLIRVLELPGAGIEFVPEPLVIWYIEERRSSISGTNDWRFSVEWLDSVKTLCSKTSYASFLLTVVSPTAADKCQWSAFLPLLTKAFREGKPQLIHVILHCAFWLLPRDTRRFFRSLSKGHVRNLNFIDTTRGTANPPAYRMGTTL